MQIPLSRLKDLLQTQVCVIDCDLKENNYPGINRQPWGVLYDVHHQLLMLLDRKIHKIE